MSEHDSPEQRTIVMGAILPTWPRRTAVLLLDGDTHLTVCEIEAVSDAVMTVRDTEAAKDQSCTQPPK